MDPSVLFMKVLKKSELCNEMQIFWLLVELWFTRLIQQNC